MSIRFSAHGLMSLSEPSLFNRRHLVNPKRLRMNGNSVAIFILGYAELSLKLMLLENCVLEVFGFDP